MKYGYFDIEKYKVMLGVYLKERRESLGISHVAFSKRLGISPYRLKKMESGQVMMTPKTLEKLKIALTLCEDHLERIEEVAHIAYVESLLQTFSPLESRV